MLKKTLGAGLLILGLLSACANPVPVQNQALQQQILRQQSAANPLSSAFFPVQAGYRWDYGVTIAPVNDPLVEEKGTYTLELLKSTPAPQGQQLELRAQSSFTSRYSFPSLLQTNSGVQLQDMTFLGLGSDEVKGLKIDFLHAGLQNGQRWEDPNWIAKVKGFESVSVPAGTFQAWRIEVIGTYDHAYTAVGDYWIAPGTGVVKSKMTIPNWHVETVLTRGGLQR